MRQLRVLALLSGIAACAATPLAAQNQTTGIVLNASLRLRAEAWNWFDTPTQDGSYVFGAVLARAALSQQLARISWRVELAAPVLIGLPDDAVAPPPAGQLGLGATYWAANDSAENVASVFLKQAFVRIGTPGAPGHASLRLGRFEFIEGTETMPANATTAAVKRDRIAHRLIGNFGFSHVQRSVDGASVTVDRKHFDVTALAFRPTSGVFDVDGWGDLNIPVGYLSINSRGTTNADWRVFGTYYNDRRDASLLKVDNRPAVVRALDREQIKVFTVGAHYVEAFPLDFGTVDFLAWGAYQFGDWGTLTHKASAYAMEAGIQAKPGVALQPWLRFGFNGSSGDDDVADGEHGTFFQMLPTPRVYARFPFYNMMNLQDGFASLLLRPSAKFTLRSDIHSLRLSETTDLWYSGGGAFEKETFGFAGRPANGKHDLATLIDLSAELRPSTHLTITGYIGLANAGDVIAAIYPESNARLGYLELEWRR